MAGLQRSGAAARDPLVRAAIGWGGMATTAATARATATAAYPGRWRALVRIHRLEYPFVVNYLCYAGWGACYAVAGPAGLLTGPVLLAAAANFILLVAQNPLNAALDMYA